ncbi:hypothetical protein, partial [Mycobacterium nebraskense]|uniref:hypothetical protein n=1 Tax=Mycobacterium nebraskense TaxID=244292 RepID=UPI0006183522
MPTIWTYMRAAAVVVGSSAALLTGGIAHADPVPAPAVPNIPQQLIASAANAPQILQNLATALGATPPAAPASPGITFPGVPSAAATSPATSAAIPSIPGLAQAPTPSAPATTQGLQGLIPGLTQPAPAAPAAPATSSIPGLPAIPGLSTPTAPATPPTPQIPQAKVDMPAFLPNLPVNMPAQMTLPQDLPC